MLTKIRGLKQNGAVVWFTGKAGDDFVSSNESEAFAGFTLEGARRKALTLNRASELHGVRFVAVVPAEEVAA